ncbi:hypothetical protein, partial [Plasmodium yoelii yoelii]
LYFIFLKILNVTYLYLKTIKVKN